MEWIIVDLDGTYFRGNTLHCYLATALRYHLRRGHAGAAGRILLAGALRLARLVPHRRFKAMALSAAGREAGLLEAFGAAARPRIDGSLRAMLMEQASEGGHVVMATAAPDYYARLLWDGPLLASRLSADGRLEELRGAAKRDAVLRHMAEAGCTAAPAVLYTDHYDDLPLALACGRTVLVRPTRRTIRRFQQSGVPAEVMGGAALE